MEERGEEAGGPIFTCRDNFPKKIDHHISIVRREKEKLIVRTAHNFIFQASILIDWNRISKFWRRKMLVESTLLMT